MKKALREHIYGILCQRFSEFNRALGSPNFLTGLEAQTELDGILWELAREIEWDRILRGNPANENGT